MSKIFNIANLYMFIATLYLLQDVAYEGGGYLSKCIILLFCFISFFITIKVNLQYKLPPFFTGLNLLIGLFTIYGLIHIISTSYDYVWLADLKTPSYTYLLTIYNSLLPIYVFYYATLKGEFSKQKIQYWTIILLLICLVKFFSYYDNLNDDKITNNAGYLFVGILTLLIFFKDKPVIQYILLTTCMVMVIVSMKRGAILTACCCLIPFLFSQWKQSKQVKRGVIALMITAFLIGSVYFIQYMLQTSNFFVARIEATKEGDSSLRDVLFSLLWNHFANNTPLLEQIFGSGANHTLQIAGNYAHNDWLEILINQGIIGIVIYIIYWHLFSKTIKSCQNIPELEFIRSCMLICYIGSGLKTFFSMSYASLPIGITMTLGICLGQISLYQEGNKTLPLRFDDNDSI